MNYSTPWSFNRHVFYIDFGKYGVLNPPIYINLIRDPVERIISSYFYRRIVASRQVANNRTKGIKPSDYWMKKVGFRRFT
jgi:dermatan/chondrotin sulfate uronyl 2-O-sulfotransferase UST